jgi:hypothetical protein
VIYFIQNKSGYGGRSPDRGLIKIGTTTRLLERLPQIAKDIGCDPDRPFTRSLPDGELSANGSMRKRTYFY